MAKQKLPTPLVHGAPIGADYPDDLRDVFVVATSKIATAHALGVATALAHGQHTAVTVLVPHPKPMTVSSGRAHAYDVVVDSTPDPTRATTEGVRALAAAVCPSPVVVDVDGSDEREIAEAMPADAEVVLGGAIHHVFESPEQRLARQLTASGHRVIFLTESDQ